MGPTRARDGEFVAFVRAHRDTLLRCAALVHDDPTRAGLAVDHALATLYGRWARTRDPLLAALAGILDPAAGRAESWDHEPRVQLLDTVPVAPPLPTGGVAADVRGLSVEERRVLVLETVARLPRPEVAGVLGLVQPAVASLSERARRRLAALDPPRADPAVLAAQLLAASPLQALPATSAEEDLSHGRMLQRRRRRRSLAAALATVVGAAFVISALLPRAEVASGDGPALPAPGPAAAQSPATTSPVSSRSLVPTGTPRHARCDTSDERCRATVVRQWRDRTARIARSYLDPQNRYFSGYGYSYNDEYDSDSYWAGGDGAVGLELFRASSGATKVTLQVATSRQAARRCGTLTGRECFTMRFMDGNRFTLTETTVVAEGIEVQHAPAGTYVISVTARNTSRGSELDLSVEDLMKLVQDERLTLPPR